MKLSLQWLFAFFLLSVPVLVLLPLGLLWLWQQASISLWLIVGLSCTSLGLGWVLYLRQQRVQMLQNLPEVDPNRNWSEQGQAAWAKVDALANQVQPNQYTLVEFDRLVALGEQVANTVALHYHPKAAQPLQETPLPYLLRIIELVCADLRKNFVSQIPGSHIITIGDIFRSGRLASLASQYYDVYRVLSLPINPTGSLMRELKDFLSKKLLNAATDNVKLWLLQTYVRKVGYYSIELYSGALVLDDIAFQQFKTDYSKDNLTESEQVESEAANVPSEPLRVLILGQVKAGKSSLVNALFGELRAATDVLPQTSRLTPYLLSREDIDYALVLDSAGYEEQQQASQFFHSIETEVLRCDLILLVCAAHQAAREADKQVLSALNELYQRHIDVPQPPVLVVLSHIDRLRPVREWSPPYNIEQPDTAKAIQIRAVMEQVATDLNLPLAQIIPVNLQAEQRYNIEEGILPAMLNQLEGAHRVRYLRCMRLFKKDEYWQQLWKQTLSTGRVLVDSIAKVAEKIDEFKR